MKRQWLMMILGVMGLSLIMRLPHLGGSFWLDEAAQALESSRPLTQQLSIREDFQPPLLHLLLFLPAQVTQNEVILRTIGALLPGLASILGSMLLARQLLPKKQALLGSALVGLLLATNSFHIFYSQELRPYALPMAFAVWSWWWLSRPQQTIRKHVVGWILLSIGGLYSSYLYPFLLLAQAVYLFWHQPKQHKQWSLGLLGIGLAFVPWLPFFWQQLQTGQLLRLQLPGWESAVSVPQLKALPLVAAKFIFGVVDVAPTPYFVISLAVVLVLIGYFAFQARKKLPLVSFLWLIIPPLAAWLISFIVPVMQPKRLVYLLPALYLFVVTIVLQNRKTVSKRNLLGVILLAVLIGLNLAGTLQYYLKPTLQREDWRGVLQYVQQRYGAVDTLSNFTGPFAPIVWYHQQLGPAERGTDFATVTTPMQSEVAAKAFVTAHKKQTGNQTLVYFEYLTDLTDPQHLVMTALESDGYRLVELLDYPGIGLVRVYQSQPTYAARN